MNRVKIDKLKTHKFSCKLMTQSIHLISTNIESHFATFNAQQSYPLYGNYYYAQHYLSAASSSSCGLFVAAITKILSPSVVCIYTMSSNIIVQLNFKTPLAQMINGTAITPLITFYVHTVVHVHSSLYKNSLEYFYQLHTAYTHSVK